MDNKTKAWVLDIQRSIDEIFEFLPEKRDFLEYKKDLRTKKAVERNLEIIGEAINRLQKAKDVKIEINHSQKIIGTRNRIIHEYDNISDEIIWTIITIDLPLLKEELREYLDK
jgi:uncharacterized protein with HEPN domain